MVEAGKVKHYIIETRMDELIKEFVIDKATSILGMSR